MRSREKNLMPDLEALLVKVKAQLTRRIERDLTSMVA